MAMQNTPQTSSDVSNKAAKKRKQNTNLSDSDSESPNDSTESSSTVFPRFLVVEPTEQSRPIKLSIFAIQKLLLCGVGSVKSAKKLFNGTVLVEVADFHQYKNAIKLTQWVDTPIKVTPHRSLNTSRGVIRCREFRDCDDEEVLEALRPEGVTAIKHIHKKVDSHLSPTNTFILTFNQPSPPKCIKAAYMRIPVDPFIPNPLRCYNCQKFGHGKSTCKHSQAVCARCGGTDHADNDCTAPAHCVNCSGNHAAYSKECPEWRKQKQIVTVKVEQNISFKEAKLQVQQLSADTPIAGIGTRRPNTSYAGAARPVSCAATQTDLTWPIDAELPVTLDNNTVNMTAAASAAAPVTTVSETQTDKCAEVSEGAIPKKPTIPRKPTDLKTNSKQSNARTDHKILAQSDQSLGSGGSKNKNSNRESKGSLDPLKVYNKYGTLDEDDSGDMECDRPSGRSPRPGK